MQQASIPGILNPNEAPDGYFAVLKSSIPHPAPNLCTFCDWRSQCQKPETDFTIAKHRCAAHPVQLHSGGAVSRADGCSVIFKRRNAT